MFEKTKPSERRTHPEIHEREVIQDPRRLAEIVLNTIDLTLDQSLLQVDEEGFSKLMEDPAKNWGEIFKVVEQTFANAKSVYSQIDAVNKDLEFVRDYPEEGLPVSQAGDPPKTIVDRRGIEQLLIEKQAKKDTIADQKALERKDWTPEQKTQAIEEERLEDQKQYAAVLADPVRRLALFISRLQEDSVIQALSLPTGYGEIVIHTGANYDPSQKEFAEIAIGGMTNAQKYLQLERMALQQYSQGNLPTETVVRHVIAGGTASKPAYLDTFSLQTPPSAGKN